MLTRFLVGFLLVFAWFTFFATSHASHRKVLTFGVMTFNIRTANVSDGENGWSNRRGLVVETIGLFEPQVVGLQEVVREQINYLGKSLPDYRWIGLDRGLNGGEGLSEYTPIFYRYKELIPIESGNFWLSATPNSPPEPRMFRGLSRRMGRIVTWARFHHVETGREVWFYNTHFTLRQGEAQIEAADLVATRVASQVEENIVVVTGDFNAAAEQSLTWRTLTAKGLTDAWVVAETRKGPSFTLSAFGPPVDWNVGRIDWILVGGPVMVDSIETVLHNDAGRYPSDHYPVAARLLLH